MAPAERAAAATDTDVRARRVRERLTAVGYEGPADSIAAIKHLREAAPGLSLLSPATRQSPAGSTGPGCLHNAWRLHMAQRSTGPCGPT
ncbi:hypothetical protein ACIP2X_33485 [Streptomyces sp. NPDC089424]|uniref:hypothetical protein n=1 Tax=Streptomyces sp. NPDC089424 TaxID=3365917 RepID=UPI003822FF75